MKNELDSPFFNRQFAPERHKLPGWQMRNRIREFLIAPSRKRSGMEKAMMISTKGRYALRVMIDLAEHQSDGYIPLKETADRQEISEKYLEGILSILVKNNLLSGLRGKGGGYRLTKSPEQYTLGSILRLTETSLAPVNCLDPNREICAKMSECRTLPVWQGLDKLINAYLDSITLADLISSSEPGNDYVI